MTAKLSADELATLAGVSPGTVRSWARRGFPGAEQVRTERGTPAWRFDAKIARRFAANLRKVNETFRVIGR